MDYAAEYTRLHEKFPKLFAGYTMKRNVDAIVKLVAEHKPKTMLDYGSGKGYQYLKHRYHERWGGLLPVCYDVGVRQLAERPEGKFDAVICTDMMEHIEEADVPRILADIFSFVAPQRMYQLDGNEGRPFVFLAICTEPEKNDVKKLSDGRGVHVTVKPAEWWERRIAEALGMANKYGELTVYAEYGT